jgi:hypothetical protein
MPPSCQVTSAGPLYPAAGKMHPGHTLRWAAIVRARPPDPVSVTLKPWCRVVVGPAWGHDRREGHGSSISEANATNGSPRSSERSSNTCGPGPTTSSRPRRTHHWQIAPGRRFAADVPTPFARGDCHMQPAARGVNPRLCSRLPPTRPGDLREGCRTRGRERSQAGRHAQ